ncbi:beta-lactamase family protein [Novosphingobium sp. NBM11]|uniref:serine hydrolase domain-containing protein n=1 Tax=Novosphingobium sp. NBM11 TaxID=2596914 RepID=UPI00189287B8|nr:serine hydrolase domain-containing protein [Novosphingobium sp. NBM11]MBF5089678.1 beta-lactamase family protein [Novosphingobium sp. NBM11]
MRSEVLPAFQGLSRRDIMRAGMLVGAGATLFPRLAFASAAAEAQWPAVTQLLDGYVSGGKLPGMIAALGWGSAAPESIARGVETKGEAAPVTMDSLFRVYSMTKPVTGMAAMILIDEGRLRLDQPLSDVLPKFAKMQVQVTPDGSITDLRPAKTPITIRHLLTHTAGLGYSIIQKGPIKAAYEQAGIVPGQITRLPLPGMQQPADMPRSLAEFADRLADLPLVYEPGTQWSYSVALDLLGRVIEVVSGQPFDRFLHDRIFGPTGMDSSWFQVPKSEVGRLTSNYGVLGGFVVPLDPAPSSIYLDPPAFPFGGAGLVSSPRDYDRFLTMLLGYGVINGRRVMSEAAVRLGTSNLLPAGTATDGTMIAGGGFGAGGRVGIGVDAGTYGWAGAAGTIAFINHRVGNRAGLYTQYMPSEAYPVQRDFPKAVIADLFRGKKAA